MSKIAVLGAGIIGISTALAIQQRIPNCQVTVIADRFSPDTTSDVAAGIIEPYLCGDDIEQILNWTSATIARIQEYTSSGNSGAQKMSGYVMKSRAEVPKWLRIMENVHILTGAELESARKRPEHAWGVFFTTWYLEPTAYIRWSTEQFVSNGGSLLREHVDSFDDVARDYDVIVNCTGLGARKLCGDREIRPVRGQVMRVTCPGVTHFFIDDQFYALLNDEWIVLGGTAEEGSWDESVDESTARRIFDGNCTNVPALRASRVLSHHTGLRPSRPTVRLETELRAGLRAPIVHNYGHGGSGVTIHWGCALECALLVRNLLLAKL